MILTRRVGETLCIGPDVTVTIMGARGNQVRIGIKAPQTTAVDRQEIAERKRAEAQIEAEKKTSTGGL